MRSAALNTSIRPDLSESDGPVVRPIAANPRAFWDTAGAELPQFSLRQSANRINRQQRPNLPHACRYFFFERVAGADLDCAGGSCCPPLISLHFCGIARPAIGSGQPWLWSAFFEWAWAVEVTSYSSIIATQLPAIASRDSPPDVSSSKPTLAFIPTFSVPFWLCRLLPCQPRGEGFYN
jgi:hypothetical protein